MATHQQELQEWAARNAVTDLLEVLVDNTTAFIDSGASHSFISPAATEKYLHPASCECHRTVISHIDNMEITLGDRSTTCVTHRTAHIHINCGSHKLHHHFFIMPLQDEHEILFGRDIMQRISVGLFGLPVSYPIPSKQEEFKEDDSNISNKDKCVELPPPPPLLERLLKASMTHSCVTSKCLMALAVSFQKV